jgi:transcriptional regulator with XRE-family HTH domain
MTAPGKVTSHQEFGLSEMHSEMGPRLQALRKITGMTQKDLAKAAGVSLSLVQKVEAGSRPGSWDLAIAVARALHVDAAALIGESAAGPIVLSERISTALPGIRRALATYDCPAEPVTAPRPLPVLVGVVEAACRQRLDAKYVALAESLAPLIEELTAAAHAASGHEREQSFWLLAAIYRCADAVAHKFGYMDLSATAIDRIGWAAERSGDELMVGTAVYVRAEIFFETKAYGPGLRLIGEAASRLEERAASDPRAASVYGALHARAAVLAARKSDATVAHGHLRIAGAAAAVVGADREYFYTFFGPSQVKIHQVAVAVELGDGAAALQAASDWAPPAGLPAERASHHFIDLARAQVWERDYGAAIASVLTARQLAPQHTKSHPYARDAVEAVLARASGRSDPTLGLAAWLGIRA